MKINFENSYEHYRQEALHKMFVGKVVHKYLQYETVEGTFYRQGIITDIIKKLNPFCEVNTFSAVILWDTDDAYNNMPYGDNDNSVEFLTVEGSVSVEFLAHLTNSFTKWKVFENV
jgi:hypothetical protein